MPWSRRAASSGFRLDSSRPAALHAAASGCWYGYRMWPSVAGRAQRCPWTPRMRCTKATPIDWVCHGSLFWKQQPPEIVRRNGARLIVRAGAPLPRARLGQRRSQAVLRKVAPRTTPRPARASRRRPSEARRCWRRRRSCRACRTPRRCSCAGLVDVDHDAVQLGVHLLARPASSAPRSALISRPQVATPPALAALAGPNRMPASRKGGCRRWSVGMFAPSPTSVTPLSTSALASSRRSRSASRRGRRIARRSTCQGARPRGTRRRIACRRTR